MSGPGRVIFWGTYDRSQPRARLLQQAVRACGALAQECHFDVWHGIEDKFPAGLPALLHRMLLTVVRYPQLVLRYLLSGAHDLVFVLSPGWLDLLVIAPFAKYRKARLVWDCYLPLYEALVEDRAIVPPRSLRAAAAFLLEGLCSRVADRIILDTETHARYFVESYRPAAAKVCCVPVGVETSIFSARSVNALTGEALTVPRILYYGRLIPLHGISVIVEACAILERQGVRFELLLIGTGHEERLLQEMLEKTGLASVKRVLGVSYRELPALIASSAVGLGIFGVSPKAQRVIPNKVFQMAALGLPVITADTPAVREFFEPGPRLRLVPAASPQALAATLTEILSNPPDGGPQPKSFGPEALACYLKQCVPELGLVDESATETS